MPVERIQEFVSVLKQLKSEDSIKGLCQDELEYLGQDLALTSKRRSITRYRTAIKEIDPNHTALQFLKLGYHEARSYKAGYKKQIKAEQSNLKPLDADAMILKADELLQSDSYIALALGLMLLSGRRSTEILKTASFEPATEYSVIFSGQLKTKGSENAQTQPYEIPLLIEADRFIAAFNRLRQLKDLSGLSNDEVNRRCAKGLSDMVKKHFWQLVPGVTAKDLRAAYATIAESLYNIDTVSADVFFATVLGHSEDDLNTAQSYKDFYLI